MITHSTIADYLFAIRLSQEQYTNPLSLIRSHAQVYSQNGEDGVISEIFSRIGIHGYSFLEFGVQNGIQNNTRFLLEQGWKGIWVDADSANLNSAREIFGDFIASGSLTIIEDWVTTDNVNTLLDRVGAPMKFDFISLDVDQNTSHIWRALHRSARLVCIEYNASLPASLEIEVPYEDKAAWDGTNWFGASLKTLETIGRAKELSLVGCELCGINAFFVEAALAEGKFLEPFTSENHWEPPRYSHVTQAGHPPSAYARHWIKKL